VAVEFRPMRALIARFCTHKNIPGSKMKCSARFFLFIRCTERKDNTSNTRKAHMNNDPAPVQQRNYTIPRRERGCWKIENKSALYFYTLYYRICICAQPSCATFLFLSLSALGGNYYIIGGATRSFRYSDDQKSHSKCARGKQSALFVTENRRLVFQANAAKAG
jgi:hypothetical protein